MVSGRRGRLALLIVAAACRLPAAALEPAQTLAGYHHSAWTAYEGAPPDIWALDQTPDGYLWLGTGNGLFRFDGMTFEPFVPHSGAEFPSNNITALTALPDGRLWAGFYFGGASLVDGDQVRHYGIADGVPPGAVYRIVVAGDGVTWLAAAGGLARFEGGRWQSVGEDWNYPWSQAQWLLEDEAGTLWVATGDALVYLPAGKRRFQATAIDAGNNAVIAAGQDGALWLSDTAGGTRPVADVTGPSDRTSAAAAGRPAAKGPAAKRLLVDHAGNLWGTGAVAGGVFRAVPGRSLDTFAQRDGLTADVAVPLLEDQEGNVWVGTNLGLNRFRRTNGVAAADVPATAVEGFALATTTDGAVWIATAERVVRHGPDDVRRTLEPGTAVRALSGAVDGSLWLAGPQGLQRRAEGPGAPIPLPGGGRVHSLAADAGGRLWLTTDDGRILLRGANAWLEPPDSLRCPGAGAVTVDAEDRAWFGCTGGYVVATDGRRTQGFGGDQGLRIGSVMTMTAEAGSIWLGGEFGAARLRDGRAQSIGVGQVPALRGITGIAATQDGYLWLNGLLGVVRVSREQLDLALADPSYAPEHRIFDFTDGMPGVAQQVHPVPTAVFDSRQRVWFATNHGVVWIDSRNLLTNQRPPEVRIRRLLAGDVAFAPDPDMELPPRTGRVLLDYTALSLSVPERNRYRYRLDGLDRGWIDAGTRRQAVYTNLPHGDYRFRVVADVCAERQSRLPGSRLPGMAGVALTRFAVTRYKKQ